MKKYFTLAMMLLALIVSLAAQEAAGAVTPDQFQGDTAIYTAASSTINMPNVLFVIDNSAGMGQAGATKPYDPDVTYPGSADPNAVYIRVTATGGTINYNQYISSIPGVTCAAALTQLLSTGAYYGKLKKSDGSCNASQAGDYVMGNLINYINEPIPIWQAHTAYSQGDVVVSSVTSTVSYVCTQAGTSGSAQPVWPTTSGTSVIDGTVHWQMSSDTILKMVQTAITQVSQAVRDSVNVGLSVFGDNNAGGKILTPVTEITDLDSAGNTNYTNLINAVNNITLLNANSQPVNEALWDAGVYYGGNNGNSTMKIGPAATYPSPIQYPCQINFIIVLSTGATDPTNQTNKSWRLPTDLNANGVIGDSADASIHNYIPGATLTFDGVVYLIPMRTFVIQLLTPAVQILQQAATGGHGKYYQVYNTTDLTKQLIDVMSSIVNPSNSSFVAPVVPVSPENKVYTGSRVYMGFFQPVSEQYWYGNLKKYAIDSSSNIVDSAGTYANFVDQNFDNIDDRDGANLPQGAQNGSFRPGAKSFWTTTADAGFVSQGGAGGVLQNRNFTVSTPTSDIAGSVRQIYTYLDGGGATTDLTASRNAFSTQNSLLTSSTSTVLGLPAATIITSGTTDDKKELINFVHGIDVYDDNGDLSHIDKRAWIFGDVLHSKPFVMNYATYNFTLDTEKDCTVNKTMIFVGSNDGMMHAVNDCDGSEAWAFIPPDLLPYLYYNHGSTHTYFVDSTIYSYVYDANQDGTIKTSEGDKVILILGLRRGGGIFNAEPTTGFYYAIDVSDPTSPIFLWSISNSQIRKGTTTTTDLTTYANLGEAWSEPKIAKIRVGSPAKDKIVMFIGGGYDNCNEDSRFGANQNFSGSCVSTITTNDDGFNPDSTPKTSGGSTLVSGLTSYKGRAVYVVELATLNAGVPDFTNSSNLVHAFTTNGYSLLSEMTALDTNFDGYVDRLYMGDTGGNIWRFNVQSTDPSAWTATPIFSSNPLGGGYTNGTADSSVGRKIFYKPSAVVDTGGIVRLYFGTGDREHPLNFAVTDRMYEVIDKGQSSAVTEAKLIDVTDDQLQSADLATMATSAFTDLVNHLAATSDPTNTTYYGWYIRLNQNWGEKVLAPGTVYNKAVYFTTYAPNTAVNPDPCQVGNLGAARIYVLDYLNGNAIMNFDTGNDTSTLYTGNSYAMPASAGGKVLVRTDRVQKIGAGIPSGVVVTGNNVLIGCGGGICTSSLNPGGQVLPVYWRQR